MSNNFVMPLSFVPVARPVADFTRKPANFPLQNLPGAVFLINAFTPRFMLKRVLTLGYTCARPLA